MTTVIPGRVDQSGSTAGAAHRQDGSSQLAALPAAAFAFDLPCPTALSQQRWYFPQVRVAEGKHGHPGGPWRTGALGALQTKCAVSIDGAQS